MSNQTKNSNLNYLIDPTFTNVNRLYVLSYKNEDDRSSFSKYYVPKVEIKDFNVLIGGKLIFEIPVKNKEEAYERIIEMSKNNDFTTGNLLDYEYFKDHKTNIFRIQADNSIMCGYFYIVLIDFMFASRKLIDFTSLFSPYDFKKNNKITITYFK